MVFWDLLGDGGVSPLSAACGGRSVLVGPGFTGNAAVLAAAVALGKLNMSQAPTPLETTQGYAPPIVTQFSVFLPNKVGKLLDLVELFDGSICQVAALSVHEASDCSIVRMITNASNQAREMLKENKLAFSETDLLVVELSQGHTLSSLCLSLLGAELNIHFAYPLMLRPNGTPTIALAVDDLTLAGQILRRKNFRLFGEGDLPSSPANQH